MNKRLEWALIAAIVVGTMVGAASAKAASSELAMLADVTNMNVGRVTTPPVGYVEFCEANPHECGRGNQRGGKIAFGEADLAQLKSVNDTVNERVQPMTDMDHYGVVERWAYPDDGFGDCEDYVLAKRRALISLGWPAETLLVTVVRDKNGDGHSVLTVATDHGDLVLDNQQPGIMPWYETGYRFVKRQAQGNPDEWVSLGDVRAPVTVGRN